MTSVVAPIDPVYRKESRLVWGLGYRMTGSASEADDILQETFARALQHRPSNDRDLRPWLISVAVNLGRDALRRRRRLAYVGPWLPSPVDDEREALLEGTPDFLLERREGATYAFLVALEVLTPQQRAVLLLRDVIERSVAETAAALGLTEVSVKVTHHRARARLNAREPKGDGLPRGEETLAALTRFVTALSTGDSVALVACMTEGVTVMTDGGGEYMAALKPVRGADRAARFFLGLRRKLGYDGRFEIRAVNGAPTLVAELGTPFPRAAPRWLLSFEVLADGRIKELRLVAASAKLTHVRSIATT